MTDIEKVYLVIGETGEHSDYTETLIYAFLNHADAQQAQREMETLATQYRKDYEVWCNIKPDVTRWGIKSPSCGEWRGQACFHDCYRIEEVPVITSLSVIEAGR